MTTHTHCDTIHAHCPLRTHTTNMDDRGSWTATEKSLVRFSAHAHWLCFTYFVSKSKSLIFKQIRQRYSTAVCQSSTEEKSEKRKKKTQIQYE